MSSTRLYIVFGILLAVSVHNVQSCGPAEIGQNYTITSTKTPGSANKVEWQLDSNVIIYSSELSDLNPFPDVFVGSRTQLTILNVNMTSGTKIYQHSIQNTPVYTCAPTIYKRASTPTCENTTLNGNQIRAKCTTAEVFPQAICQFTLLNGGTRMKDISDGTSYITYTHTDPQPGVNEYYSTSCALQYPVDGLAPGNWTVQVTMHPNVTGLSSDKGATGQAANSLTLSISTVRIDYNNCPQGLAGEGDTNVRQGYIRQGERASCLCTRLDAGNPPGTVGWSSTHGGNFVVLSKSEDASTIQINSPDTFTCQSTSLLNGSEPKTYTPQYAYGPSSASVIFQPPGPIYLCPNEGANTDAICEVPINSFNPALLFTFRDVNSNNLATKTVNDTVNFIFTKSGPQALTCLAENAIFSDIFSEAPPSAIEVYAPPTDPPEISARSSQHGRSLVEGDDVIVTCSVMGGYPSVQSVTLTCGQDPSLTSKGNSVKLPIPFIQLKYHDANCTCQASHVTGCYDLMDVLILTVLSVNVTIAEVEKLFTPKELAGGIIGTTVTFVVLVAAIALILFYVRREKRKRNKDTGYDMIERPSDQGTGQPYQNVRPRDPNYWTINPPDPIPGNESTNEETETSHRNQTYDDSTEPIERADVNGYSEIKEADVNGYSEIKEADVNGYSEIKEADVNGSSEIKED